MYCYAYDACMHDTKIRNDILCSKIPNRLRLNAYTMNLEEQWKKESYFQSKIQFFLFTNFLVDSHYFDHLSFKHTFFVKEHNFFIFNIIIFWTTLFYSRHVIFFTTFCLTLKFFFVEENEYDTFFSFFIQNKTLSYFEKGTEWKTIFVFFSSEIPNTFFRQVRKNFFRILMKS